MLGLLAVLGACSRAPEEAAPTVDYYRAHADEREATLKTCANDPGGVGRSARCVNAGEAARQVGIGSFKDLPPMGLSPSSPPARKP